MGIGWWILIILVVFSLYVRFWDKRHTVLSNFLFIGLGRYVLESVGPELRQYIVANDREERPFSRVWRRIWYSMAKLMNDKIGFGSNANFYDAGHITLLPFREDRPPMDRTPREVIKPKKIIGPQRRRPFQPKTIFNTSAISYGAFNERATKTFNIGSAGGNSWHNTGEGGFDPELHDNGADVIFQFGTGYFGCGETMPNGGRQFRIEMLVALVEKYPCIKAIEIKDSQGAKPGLGGVLPKRKITDKIAEMRNIPKDEDCVSPAFHSAYKNMEEFADLCEDIAEATGLPVGGKFAVGHSYRFKRLAWIKAKTGKGPDFLTVDGGDGGTGASYQEFADNVGRPFLYAFPKVYKAYKGYGVEDQITFIGSGKLGHPTKAAMAFAMGVDIINSARAQMTAAGCLHTQKCHENICPAGLATTIPWLKNGLDIKDKSKKVANAIKKFHVRLDRLAIAHGYEHPSDFQMDDVEINANTPLPMTLEELFGYQKRS